MEKKVTLTDKLTAAAATAVLVKGGPVTIGEILMVAEPYEGYVREFREVALKVTKVVAYTPQGVPLRVCASCPGYLPAAVLATALAETA